MMDWSLEPMYCRLSGIICPWLLSKGIPRAEGEKLVFFFFSFTIDRRAETVLYLTGDWPRKDFPFQEVSWKTTLEETDCCTTVRPGPQPLHAPCILSYPDSRPPGRQEPPGITRAKKRPTDLRYLGRILSDKLRRIRSFLKIVKIHNNIRCMCVFV